jgi:hypothetical protein
MSRWVSLRVRSALVLLLALALVAGCGGGDADVSTTADAADTGSTAGTTSAPPTTSAPETTTTAASATTQALDGGEMGIDDVPESCVEVIRALLDIYAPHVGGVDWQTATIQDHIDLTMALASTDFSSLPDTTQCESEAAGSLDFTGQTEDGAALFLAIAEREVPDVAEYFGVILEAREQVGDKETTGDCQTDIATFQEYVDGGVPFMELPLGDQLLILGLMNSIGFCSLQTQGELMFSPDTQEFLAGSPFAGE